MQTSPFPTTSASPALVVSVDPTGGLVQLSGELDRDSAHHLLDALGDLIDAGHRAVYVDAAEVTFCDAGGLRALVLGSRLIRAGCGELRVVRASRCVGRLLVLSGLDVLTGAGAAPDPLPAADDLTARRRPRPRVERTISLGRRTATA